MASGNLNRCCSFCGKKLGDVEALIAGPTCFICNQCAVTALHVAHEEGLCGNLVLVEFLKDQNKAEISGAYVNKVVPLEEGRGKLLRKTLRQLIPCLGRNLSEEKRLTMIREEQCRCEEHIKTIEQTLELANAQLVKLNERAACLEKKLLR